MSKLELFTPSKSESHRQKKVAEEIRFHLSNILVRGDLPIVRSAKTGKFLELTTPITVTHVDISADLRHVNVYITSLGGIDQTKALEFMKLQRGYLRKTMGSKMQLRYTPDLHFRLDESFSVANDMMQKIATVIARDNEKAGINMIDETIIENDDHHESPIDISE